MQHAVLLHSFALQQEFQTLIRCQIWDGAISYKMLHMGWCYLCSKIKTPE